MQQPTTQQPTQLWTTEAWNNDTLVANATNEFNFFYYYEVSAFHLHFFLLQSLLKSTIFA
jgi:hypothetical protein